MRTKLSKIAVVAAFGLALALTFSCSSDDSGVGGSGRGGNGSSSSGDGGSSPSVGSGKCGQFVGTWLQDGKISNGQDRVLIITDTDDWRIDKYSNNTSDYNGTVTCNGNTAKLKMTKNSANVDVIWTATISNNKITLDETDSSVDFNPFILGSYSKYELNGCKAGGKQLYCQTPVYSGSYINGYKCNEITDKAPEGYVERSCEEIAASCYRLGGELYVGVEASEIAVVHTCKTYEYTDDYVCGRLVYTPESGLKGASDRTERKDKCSENGGLLQCDKNSLDESAFYNEETHFCYENEIYDNEIYGKCGWTSSGTYNYLIYNLSTQRCCNSYYDYSVYNPLTQGCCEHYGSYSSVYNLSTQYCSNGSVFDN